MRAEGLRVVDPKKRKYSPYQGDISASIPNVIDRDFRAHAPNVEWLTDMMSLGAKIPMEHRLSLEST